MIFRILASRFKRHQIYRNEPPSIRNRLGNFSKYKMLPIIYRKQFITLMMLTALIISSKYRQYWRPNSCLKWLLCVFFFRSSDEVLHIITNILDAVQRARISLVIPKKKPIQELIKSRNMVSFIQSMQSAHLLPSSRRIFFLVHVHK